MKRKGVVMGNLFMFVMLCSHCNERSDFPMLKGPYLGQSPPGMTPELFAPGIVSTRHYENSITISPDGNEIFYAITSPTAGRGNLFVILFVKKENNRWTQPQVASFSGQYVDGFPCFSPDSKRLYFASYRPLKENEAYKRDWNIWVTERTAEDWSNPKSLGPAINTEDRESSPTVTTDGTLYFKRSGRTGSDIFRSRFTNGRYEEPEKLSDAINTETSEDHPFIAPDESYLLFSSWRRPNGFGEADLYISFRRSDGSWGQAENLGETINTNTHENCPIISPDGKYLFFNSYKKDQQKPFYDKALSYDEVMEKLDDIMNGFPNIYWVDAKIIDQFKPEGY